MKIHLSLILSAILITSALAVPRADRTAKVDAEGVLRWNDDGAEVALVGVNYYPPFTCDYRHLTDLHADIKEEMRRDVAHFRRLGLGVVRIHCFDREFSTADGGFVDNHHVELLDYLIDLCAENGIYMVLTPIAWWGGGHYAPGNIDGFSNHFDMRAMTSDRRAWKVQARFLKAFAEHVNRYTGRRYADDPAVLAFECINEPLYPRDHPDSEVTAYIDALVDGLRASGTTKPVYYNSWQNRNAAAGASTCDGVTGSYYPTGLVAGHALEGPQLGRIHASSLMPDASIAKKSRLIYEFDAADTPGSYMYPAMGRLFRHEGVQVAAMFQYDPLRIANINTGWKTHHLNLVYTPAKALSIAIMAETFRHLPRNCGYAPHGTELVFPPFRVDAARDLSEFLQGDRYYYTSDPVARPSDVAALRHVWGCGTSAVAGSTGNGAYFLDRIADGVWRLQLYPSVFTVNDPYSGSRSVKEVVVPEHPAVTVQLPDLGTGWTATGPATVRARNGRAVLAPGDYVLTRDAPTDGQLAAARAADLPPFVAPAPEAPTPRISAKVPAQWRAGTAMPFALHAFAATNVRARLVRAADGTARSFPVAGTPPVLPADLLAPGDWRLSFTAEGAAGRVDLPSADSDAISWGRAPGARPVSLMPAVTARPVPMQHNVGASATRRPDGSILLCTDDSAAKDACGGFAAPLAGISACDRPAQLVVEAENLGAGDAWLEIGFRTDKGGFGVNARLRPGRNVVAFMPEEIQPLWGGPRTARPWERIRQLSVLTGAWLMRGRPLPAQSVVLRRLERVEVAPGFALRACGHAADWEFFDVRAALRRGFFSPGAGIWRQGDVDDRGEPAVRLHAESFTGRVDSASFRLNADGAAYARLFPQAGRGRTLLLRARALQPATDRLEVAFALANGQVWGAVVPLSCDWREIRIPLDTLRYFQHWNLPPIAETDRPDIRQVQSVNFCFGKWLFPASAHLPHDVEVSSLRIED